MSSPAEPPWIARQAARLLAQRGHAWLLHGPSGLGQYRLGLALAQAWLCEQPRPDGPCMQCISCHAVAVRSHADLCVLMPETVMLELGWPLSEKAQQEIDEKKRKPSREIRVEAMRDALEFCQRTSARGRGKAVLVYPAERMNPVTANTLLKTLEEPPGDTRFVLATESGHQLLPTVRSRCLGHAMEWPEQGASLAWLQAQGLAPDDAAIWLQASGGRPEDALQWAQAGRTARQWQQLPKAMARGDGSALADWTPQQVLDALQRLSHDALAAKAGASPRFFRASDLPPGGDFATLSDWSRALMRAGRTVDHPFQAGLMVEALVSQARAALNSGN